MTAEVLIAALALPPQARVNQRIPKTLLQEHGASTAADRKLIQEAVEEATWVAALKPGTVGVPAYRDDVREYLEIAIVSLSLRSATGLPRLAAIVHRAVPYPVVLAASHAAHVALSLAHKRRSQADSGRWVVDDVLTTDPFGDPTSTVDAAFLNSLALAKQPRTDLNATYQGWASCAIALAAARLTGVYDDSSSPATLEARRKALDELQRLERERTTLRARAVKERQIARRVELNLELRRLDARRTELLTTL